MPTQHSMSSTIDSQAHVCIATTHVQFEQELGEEIERIWLEMNEKCRHTDDTTQHYTTIHLLWTIQVKISCWWRTTTRVETIDEKSAVFACPSKEVNWSDENVNYCLSIEKSQKYSGIFGTIYKTYTNCREWTMIVQRLNNWSHHQLPKNKQHIQTH